MKKKKKIEKRQILIKVQNVKIGSNKINKRSKKNSKYIFYADIIGPTLKPMAFSSNINNTLKINTVLSSCSSI